jgi:hypothetical protein
MALQFPLTPASRDIDDVHSRAHIGDCEVPAIRTEADCTDHNSIAVHWAGEVRCQRDQERLGVIRTRHVPAICTCSQAAGSKAWDRLLPACCRQLPELQRSSDSCCRPTSAWGDETRAFHLLFTACEQHAGRKIELLIQRRMTAQPAEQVPHGAVAARIRQADAQAHRMRQPHPIGNELAGLRIAGSRLVSTASTQRSATSKERARMSLERAAGMPL